MTEVTSYQEIPVIYRNEASQVPLAADVESINRLIDDRLRPGMELLKRLLGQSSDKYVFTWAAVQMPREDDEHSLGMKDVVSSLADALNVTYEPTVADRQRMSSLVVQPWNTLFLLENEPVTIDYGFENDRLFDQSYVIGPCAIPLENFSPPSVMSGDEHAEMDNAAILFVPGCIAFDVNSFLNDDELKLLLSLGNTELESRKTPPISERSEDEFLFIREILLGGTEVSDTAVDSRFLTNVLRRIFPEDFFVKPIE